jgi:hypothetical protein
MLLTSEVCNYPFPCSIHLTSTDISFKLVGWEGKERQEERRSDGEEEKSSNLRREGME